MQLIEVFDILSDFYSNDELSVIFSQEKKDKVPSHVMWALLLYYHPSSTYYALEPAVKLELIQKDYLSMFKPIYTLKVEEHKETIEKIELFLMTKPARLLLSWETKLEERDAFMKGHPYNEESYEMLDKMLEKSYKMWQQYKEIHDAFLKDKETKTHGAISESLSEKGLI